MVKQLPLTKLQGCGKPFSLPHYSVRWALGKARKELEVSEEEGFSCGSYHSNRSNGHYHRRYKLLCEECLKKSGISW